MLGFVEITRKAEPTVQTRQTDKNSSEKSGFDFLGEFVLAEGLGGGARHPAMRNRLVRSRSQYRIDGVFNLIRGVMELIHRVSKLIGDFRSGRGGRRRNWTPRNAEPTV